MPGALLGLRATAINRDTFAGRVYGLLREGDIEQAIICVLRVTLSVDSPIFVA